MNDLAIIILAAGLGKRMGNPEPKVLTKTISDKFLLQHVLETAEELSPSQLIVVTGHQSEKVEKACSTLLLKTKIDFVLQAEQLGTGHAVATALPALNSNIKQILILFGDVPLTKKESLINLLQEKSTSKSKLALITMLCPVSTSYGRIVRNTDGEIERIVERKDCTNKELIITEMNTGICISDRDILETGLKTLTPNNKQKEYLLTDVISFATQAKHKITSLILPEPEEVQGVNNPLELFAVNRYIIRKTAENWQLKGIDFIDPDSCFIDPRTTIESPVLIGPNVQIHGKCSIGKNVKIDGDAYIINSIIKAGSHLKNFIRIEDSEIGENCQIGPFAHLRPASRLANSVKVGNFVETKNVTLHDDVKASHLSYLGDAEINAHTNIGAGTIFANYDGVNKHKTTVGKNCFIGSNSTLVAPVSVGDSATLGAGSVLRTDLPANSLGVSKAEFLVKSGWKRKG